MAKKTHGESMERKNSHFNISTDIVRELCWLLTVRETCSDLPDDVMMLPLVLALLSRPAGGPRSVCSDFRVFGFSLSLGLFGNRKFAVWLGVLCPCVRRSVR